MGGGQKSETTVEQPKWYQEAAKRNLRIANQAAQIGYVPYQGADVAAFAPQQVQGMQMANNMAAAFGGKGAKAANVQASLPKAETFGGGVNGGPAIRGYSSYGGFQDEQDRMRDNMPGLFKYLSDFVINRQTGEEANIYGKDKLAADANATKGESADGQTKQEYLDMLNAMRGRDPSGVKK